MLSALLNRIALHSTVYQACSDVSFQKDRRIHVSEESRIGPRFFPRKFFNQTF